MTRPAATNGFKVSIAANLGRHWLSSFDEQMILAFPLDKFNHTVKAYSVARNISSASLTECAG